jgi:ABC-type Fe3+ transport system permease subunit
MKLETLQRQYEMAELLGASPYLIFKKIVFPQVFGVIVFLGGLSAFWAFGDFSISVLLAPNDFTLSLMVKSLLSSYRLELASFYSFIVLALGAVLFLVIMGLGHVANKKLNS